MDAERYVTVRPHEARALLSLGVRAWSAEAGALAQADVRMQVAPRAGEGRVFVLVSDPAAGVDVLVGGVPLEPLPGPSGVAGDPGGEVRGFGRPLEDGGAGAAHGLAEPAARALATLEVRVSTGAVVGVWLVQPGPT
jgi:hypothetical protein